MNLLESLKRYTTVVADTGDIEAINLYKPHDATTNPSLINAAARKPEYASLLDDAIQYAMMYPGDRPARREAGMDKLMVNFGCEILTIVPGRARQSRTASNTKANSSPGSKLRSGIGINRSG